MPHSLTNTQIKLKPNRLTFDQNLHHSPRVPNLSATLTLNNFFPEPTLKSTNRILLGDNNKQQQHYSQRLLMAQVLIRPVTVNEVLI